MWVPFLCSRHSYFISTPLSVHNAFPALRVSTGIFLASAPLPPWRLGPEHDLPYLQMSGVPINTLFPFMLVVHICGNACALSTTFLELSNHAVGSLSYLHLTQFVMALPRQKGAAPGSMNPFLSQEESCANFAAWCSADLCGPRLAFQGTCLSCGHCHSSWDMLVLGHAGLVCNLGWRSSWYVVH